MTSAKICIVGAGAIGGYLAVRLARAGNQVSVIARGAQLAAIRSRGLTPIDAEGGRETAAGLAATDALADLGQQDITRPRCCRISKRGAPSKSTPRSAR